MPWSSPDSAISNTDPLVRCYQTLGIRPGASRNEIKQAYRDLVRVWHPDRFAGDAALQEKAGRKTQEINEAYRRLLHGEGDRPAFAASGAPAHAAEPRIRHFFFDVILLGFVLVLLVGGLYVYSLLKDGPGRSQFGPAASREWEWAHFFKPGSTKDEVLSVQGSPDRVDGDTWFYGRDRVTFRQDRVASYSNDGGRLRVRILPETLSTLAADHFSPGATKDEVLAVQGTPSSMEGDRWSYGADYVLFSSGKVSRIVNARGALRAKPVAKPSIGS